MVLSLAEAGELLVLAVVGVCRDLLYEGFIIYIYVCRGRYMGAGRILRGGDVREYERVLLD